MDYRFSSKEFLITDVTHTGIIHDPWLNGSASFNYHNINLLYLLVSIYPRLLTNNVVRGKVLLHTSLIRIFSSKCRVWCQLFYINLQLFKCQAMLTVALNLTLTTTEYTEFVLRKIIHWDQRKSCFWLEVVCDWMWLIECDFNSRGITQKCVSYPLKANMVIQEF